MGPKVKVSKKWGKAWRGSIRASNADIAMSSMNTFAARRVFWVTAGGGVTLKRLDLMQPREWSEQRCTAGATEMDVWMLSTNKMEAGARNEKRAAWRAQCRRSVYRRRQK